MVSQPLTILNSSHYGTEEGIMTSPIVDMAKDAQGFLWLSSRIGLQRFDGNKFYNIPLSNDAKGLPDNQSVHFLNLKNGQLLMAHGQGISLYDPIRNAFTHPVLRVLNSPKALIPLGEIAEKSEFICFDSDGFLIAFDSQTWKKKAQYPIGKIPYYGLETGMHGIKNSVFYAYENQLRIVDFSIKKIVQTLPFTNPVLALHPIDAENVLVFCQNYWQIWQLTTNTLSSKHAYPDRYNLPNVGITPSVQTVSDGKIIVAFGTKLMEFDAAKKNFSTVFTNRERHNFIENGYYSKLFVDNKKTLWAASNLSGLLRVNSLNRAIKYYGTSDRKSNFTKCILVDKKCNRVISGTYGHGILIFDTLQKLIKHIPKIEPQLGGENIVTTIADLDDTYCVFRLFTSPKFYILNKINGEITALSLPFSPNSFTAGYYSLIVPAPNGLFYLSRGGNILCRFGYKNARIYFIDSVLNISGDFGIIKKNENMIWGSADSLYFYTNKKISQKYLGKTNFRHFAQDRKGTIWVANEHNLLEMRPPQYKIEKTWTTENGLPDNNIYAVAVDKKDRVWVSHNKGISVLGNAILNLNRVDGLQDNEFNTAAVAQSPDGELFFGGVNGISSFYPDDVLTLADTPSVILTQLRVKGEPFLKDSAVWQMPRIELDFAQNVIDFDYAALGLYAAENYNYQIRLQGYDAVWINMLNVKSVRYLLAAGEYRLDLYASRSFDPNAKPIRSVLIVVKPPFWRTLWFILLVLAVIGGLIWLTIRLYFRRQYRKKLIELTTQKKIQEEKIRISRDLHDNLGAQLSHIIRSVEWLLTHKKASDDNENQLLDSVQKTAKASISLLRESIWTLNMPQITGQDFVERLKKMAFQLIKSSPQTALIFKENMGHNIILTPEQSLAFLRIAQEAFNNALKYAVASKIKIDIEIIENQYFTLKITDNGKGFDLSAAEGLGNGLENMTRRAESIDATFLIKSEREKGTIISLKLPINTTND